MRTRARPSATLPGPGRLFTTLPLVEAAGFPRGPTIWAFPHRYTACSTTADHAPTLFGGRCGVGGGGGRSCVNSSCQLPVESKVVHESIKPRRPHSPPGEEVEDEEGDHEEEDHGEEDQEEDGRSRFGPCAFLASSPRAWEVGSVLVFVLRELDPPLPPRKGGYRVGAQTTTNTCKAIMTDPPIDHTQARTPKSSEGGRMSSGSGLRKGRRRGEEKVVRTPAGMSWVRIPSRSHDRSWRACSRASWRCSGRHPSPPGLVLGVRCVIVWAHPSTRSFSSSGVMLEGWAVHPPTTRAHGYIVVGPEGARPVEERRDAALLRCPDRTRVSMANPSAVASASVVRGREGRFQLSSVQRKALEVAGAEGGAACEEDLIGGRGLGGSGGVCVTEE
eukprot:scaffold20388_cov103-Isochrysis_galbana.AAC.2